ncbi:hypothetical protein JOE57_003587 [Microlunatus panaciterrae]|uniref:Mannosylglycerate hydrolase MGH1-like glycoside hydrolase domain-containing protein n=1 Tax=Microlunatus panaciterrae TaxID=400768 RepID=A0ABS2RNT0_9ACTN|nr:hypothetical protein [Microlunatus panaciterrae]MBM7800666.1 hypothetical protein [Microlunatus panaciterrae]
MNPSAVGFPADDYTPYGYLNLPTHTRRLSPRGVLRSNGVGFEWHYPALAATYGGRRKKYRAGLRCAGVDLGRTIAPHHSSNVVVFEYPSGRSTWFTLGDDLLCGRLETTDQVVHLVAEYERVVSADGEWGESGLVGRLVEDRLVLQSFEDGDAFALMAVGAELEVSFDDHGRTRLTLIGDSQDQLTLRADLRVRPNGAGPVSVLMARGATADDALTKLALAPEPDHILQERLAADHAFWADAPVLTGDWPEHWRRGVVYDLETLRMMIKEPIGIYRHRWDAMQIQSPRIVLAEAAMDALALAWAQPEVAAEILLGVFADAPLPNVPCSREDGSYNMVSADGTVCGTGPQWGFPFLVAERIADRLPAPDHWLRDLYPHLSTFLGWWLDYRRDADGWLVHACSWESGQDLSPRFGDQPLGGGHPTWALRPVDLHAAVAHAATLMSTWAELVAPEEASRWRSVAAEMTERTRQLWRPADDGAGRFADVDGSSGRPTAVDDVMLLSPLALAVASTDQARALETALEKVDPVDLVWPMFVWTPVLAAEQIGRPDIAGGLSADVIDRAYRHWDARTYDGTTTLPGVACEYWPLSGRCGGEGYGWGAFTVELLISTVVGVALGTDGITVRPNLPEAFRVSGRRYALAITIRGHRREIVLQPGPDRTVRVSGLGEPARLTWGEALERSWTELG